MCVVVNILEILVDAAYEARTAEIVSLRSKLSIYVHYALWVECIDDLGVAERALAFGSNDHLAVLIINFDRTSFFQTIAGILETVIFDEAVVVVNETFAFSNDVLALDVERSHTTSSIIKCHSHIFVEEASFVESHSLTPFASLLAVCCKFGQLATFSQSELCVSDAVTLFAELLCIFINGLEVEVNFSTCRLHLVQSDL